MRRFYYLLRATIWLFLAFGRAAWHFKFRVPCSLDLPSGLAMDFKELRRLKHYFYGTTYLAAVICSLRNRPRSLREKHLFDNLSALAYSFDDLVDSRPRKSLKTSEVFPEIEAFGLAADKRGLAQHLLHNIYRAMPEEGLAQFRAFMQRVFEVETAGNWGTGNWELGIGGLGDCLPAGRQGELEKITAEKGGCSVLLFRSVLGHVLSKEEEDALFQFGYLIQLCDDVFDLWHDRQASIATTATFLAERGEVFFLKKIFEQQVAATHRAFRQTAYRALQVETALYALHFLVSVTRVCLRHYQDLEKEHGALPLDDRAAMVVDMQGWGNRFRAVGYLLQPLR